MDSANRPEYLRRLIQGLEQTIESMKFEIPCYKPDDLQLRYAQKFLVAAEENLAKAKKELEDLATKNGPGHSSS